MSDGGKNRTQSERTVRYWVRVCAMFWIFYLVTKSNELRLLLKLAFTTDSYRNIHINTFTQTETTLLVVSKNGKMRQAIQPQKRFHGKPENETEDFLIMCIVLLHHFDIVSFFALCHDICYLTLPNSNLLVTASHLTFQTYDTATAAEAARADIWYSTKM